MRKTQLNEDSLYRIAELDEEISVTVKELFKLPRYNNTIVKLEGNANEYIREQNFLRLHLYDGNFYARIFTVISTTTIGNLYAKYL